MKSNEKCRMELVPTQRIRRMPGMQAGANRKGVEKVRDFAKKRGCCGPVFLSDRGGCMTLLSGAAAFEACIEEKEPEIPAVIVQTGGEADDLMFALQSAELNDGLSAVAAGAAIVRLIDTHNVPRRHIAETLGKSPAWLNKMETLSRRLNREVQGLVAEGHVPARSAQEIARLPGNVQLAFAISARNDCLSKDSVAYLVNRYLNEDTGAEERDRIINRPKQALPNDLRRRGKTVRDNSVSARLSRAIAGCLDANAYLCSIVARADINEAAVRIADVEALVGSLTDLGMLLTAVFYPGKSKGGGDAHDRQ